MATSPDHEDKEEGEGGVKKEVVRQHRQMNRQRVCPDQGASQRPN